MFIHVCAPCGKFFGRRALSGRAGNCSSLRALDFNPAARLQVASLAFPFWPMGAQETARATHPVTQQFPLTPPCSAAVAPCHARV
eukprot:534612-Alexandrium_andersonii.AAC.1